MKTIAVVLVAVACVAGNSVQDDPWIDRTFNEASIKLFDIERNNLLGAINFSQFIFESPTRNTTALGRLWGLPAGTYFGAVYPANNTCDQQEPALQIYDESIKGKRPLIIFFNEIDDFSNLQFTNEVGHLSLGLQEGNNIINHTVLVYPATWDQSGPLNSYLQPSGPTAVACGTITSGLLEHHVFQIPYK